MNARYREHAALMRALLARGPVSPVVFRRALTSVPAGLRDAWLDAVFGLTELAEDGPDLPRGCVPYVPCSVAAVLQVTEGANVEPSDVFVDIGSGVGRAAALAPLVTGASAIGVEVQAGHARAARALARRLNAQRLVVIEGDAAELTRFITIGTVFFLYCPFSGERLNRVLGALEAIARLRTIRVACVDMPLLACSWLTPHTPCHGDVVVYRSAPAEPAPELDPAPRTPSLRP